jgi:hypothetical protein
MTCFTTILAVVLGVFLLASLIRWFDEATEAVANGWWNRVSLLLLFPFSCWFYPTKVAAGRPTPVPHHEPVRGFGSMPKSRPQPETPSSVAPSAPAAPAVSRAAPAPAADDQPPPGTPKEFLEKPKVPPKKKVELDPEKIAKLKAKMREQGMLGDEE